MRLRLGRAWLGLLTFLVLTGCGAEGERRATAPRSSTKAPDSHTSQTPETGQSDEPACKRLHASVARGFSVHIANAVDMVSRSSSGSSERASPYLRTMLDRRVQRVETACQTTPASLHAFERETAKLTRLPLNRHRQRRLVAAYGQWAKPLGFTARVTDLEAKLSLCDTYHRGVQAYYTEHGAPTSYGKKMWVDQTIRNDTSRRVLVYQSGVLWARGIRPGYAGEWDRTKQAWLYSWGGSSADPEVLVQPGTAETARAVVGPGYLPMRPDGTILEARPDLWLSPGYNSEDYCRVHTGREP
jgi:hypothetical protein